MGDRLTCCFQTHKATTSSPDWQKRGRHNRCAAIVSCASCASCQLRGRPPWQWVRMRKKAGWELAAGVCPAALHGSLWYSHRRPSPCMALSTQVIRVRIQGMLQSQGDRLTALRQNFRQADGDRLHHLGAPSPQNRCRSTRSEDDDTRGSFGRTALKSSTAGWASSIA